jgi:hypothetical protein
MQDLRQKEAAKIPDKKSKLKFPDENLTKKYLILSIKLLLFILLFFVLFYPTDTAMIITNWINKFVGTLVKNIHIT